MPKSLLHLKRAEAPTPGPDSGFEQQFSQLAFSYIKEQAPRFMDYVVGFELIDRDQDGEKAVGVCGAKAGDAWMYVPIFFLAGKIKGQELLWLKSSGTFVPCDESWVDKIIANRPFTLGEESDDPLPAHGAFAQPNFRRVVRPWADFPKMGALAGRFRPWALPAASLYARARVDDGFAKQAVFAGTLPEQVDRLGLHGRFAYLYDHHPWLKSAFDRHYGADAAAAIKAAAAEKRARAARFASLPALPRTVGQKAASAAKAAAEKPKVRVYFYDGFNSHGPGTDGLTDAQKSKLLRDRVLVVDDRPEGGKSTAFHANADFEAHNPSLPGVYDVLTSDGGSVRAAVLPGPRDEKSYPTLLVIPTEKPTDASYCKPSECWASGSGDGLREWVAGLSSAEKSPGKYLVAVAPDGTCSTAFSLDEKTGDGVWSADFRSPYSEHMTAPKGYGYGCCSSASVRFDAPGARLHWSADCLFIPSNYKLVEVGKAYVYSSESPRNAGDDYRSPTSKRIAFGRPEDLQKAARKAANLKLHQVGGGEVVVSTLGHGGRNWRVSEKAAFASLVGDFGLPEADARAMLKAAAKASVSHNAALFVVKYANGMIPPVGPRLPYFPEQEAYAENFGTSSAIVRPSQDEVVTAVSPEYPPGDPFYLPDARALQVARRAAQSGQRDAFDVSVLSTMLKTPVEDQDLGVQMRALDDLGRRLFGLYARYSDYEERYGKNDLPELEDGLRNTFTSLGKIVYFLQEQDARDVPGLFTGGAGKPGPNVDDDTL